jgi:hypothetical protein
MGSIHAYNPGVHAPSVVELHNSNAVRVLSIVALSSHGGSRDVNAGEGGELSRPFHVDPFEV